MIFWEWAVRSIRTVRGRFSRVHNISGELAFIQIDHWSA